MPAPPSAGPGRKRDHAIYDPLDSRTGLAGAAADRLVRLRKRGRQGQGRRQGRREDGQGRHGHGQGHECLRRQEKDPHTDHYTVPDPRPGRRQRMPRPSETWRLARDSRRHTTPRWRYGQPNGRCTRRRTRTRRTRDPGHRRRGCPHGPAQGGLRREGQAEEVHQEGTRRAARPDKKLPGYKAEFGDISTDQIIQVSLVHKRAQRPEPKKGKDKDDAEADLLDDNKPHASLILIASGCTGETVTGSIQQEGAAERASAAPSLFSIQCAYASRRSAFRLTPRARPINEAFCAAEAEAVAQDVLDAASRGDVGDVIEVAVRVGVLVVDRRRQHALGASPGC